MPDKIFFPLKNKVELNVYKENAEDGELVTWLSLKPCFTPRTHLVEGDINSTNGSLPTLSRKYTCGKESGSKEMAGGCEASLLLGLDAKVKYCAANHV